MNFQSKEARFLQSILDFEKEHVPKHPILAILFGQLKILLTLVNENDNYQKTVARVLTFIKENWK